MTLQEYIDDNTTLHYVSCHESTYDNSDNEVVTIYELSFSFYDCDYLVHIKKENIDNDLNYILVHGDSKLIESFESMCEEELWDLIKQRCIEFDDWYTFL